MCVYTCLQKWIRHNTVARSLQTGVIIGFGLLVVQSSFAQGLSSPDRSDFPNAGFNSSPFNSYDAGSRTWRNSIDRVSPDLMPPAEQARQPEPSSNEAKITADRLRHPLTSKARKMIAKAQALSEKGEHTAAIQTLLETREKYPSAAPYVHSLLGIEFAKTQQYAQSAEELTHAVALMPHEAVNHSNLAYSLCFLGRFEEAEAAVRRALELDGTSNAAKQILSAIENRKAKVAFAAPDAK